jgi:HSP20 family protein
MFTKLNDRDRIFGTMDNFRNQMNRFFEDMEAGQQYLGRKAPWPKTNFYDDGDNIIVRFQVPGVHEENINLQIHNNLLSITGMRKPLLLEGYTVLREERLIDNFSRSFTLPVEIDTEKTNAILKNGILTLKLVKAQAARPKKIIVKAE